MKDYEKSEFQEKMKMHGERIRHIRNKENLTQEKLLEILEIDQSTLSRAENGASFLPAKAAVYLYLAFGYSLDWLYGISDAERMDSDISVNIGDFLRYEDGKIVIAIKEKYLKDIIRVAELTHDPDITNSALDDGFPRFADGLRRQRRNAIYFGNDNTYYQASADIEDFEKVL